MPSAMTHPSTSTIMRPKPVNKYSAGNHPQWMRTLEEKYQRLHKKIAENTTMINLKFSHVRNPHDVRLSHGGSRYRDSNTIKTNRKANDKRNCSPVNSPTTNTITGENTQTETLTEDQNGNCLQPNNRSIETEQTLNKTATNERLETGSEESTEELETDDKQSIASGESSEQVKDTDGAVSYSDTKNNNVTSPVGNKFENENDNNEANKCGDINEVLNSEETVNDGSETRRDLKTAFSRTSRNTAKSCPAQIQARSKLRQRPKTQETSLRSKSAHKKSEMFNRMSKEAHHAITETVREMNATRSQTCFSSIHDTVIHDGVQFCPSRQRKSVKTWVLPKSESRNLSAGYNAARVLESASKKMQQLMDSNVEILRRDSSEVGSSENQSCRSSNASSTDLARNNSSKLPEIQNGYPKERLTSKSQLYRLPGIGNYDVPVANDGLFEITPPGFDSRYKDLTPVEERESETPPPDIRQQAIEKCSEWLTKYSNR